MPNKNKLGRLWKSTTVHVFAATTQLFDFLSREKMPEGGEATSVSR